MRIIKMLPEHLKEVKALLDLCFNESAWSLEALRSQLNKPDSVCTIALADDRIAGFLAFEKILDEGSITELAVHPDYRRRGIAKMLIEQAEKSAADLSSTFLEVRESNTPAIMLYKSVGFEEIGRRLDYYDSPKENAIIMRKIYEDTRN